MLTILKEKNFDSQNMVSFKIKDHLSTKLKFRVSIYLRENYEAHDRDD